MIKVSIIVPIYNVEQYLKRCLDSLASQTLKNVEVIMIDDGSTDSSGKIADEYSRKYDNFKILHKPNGGLSSARNKGIEQAKGEYIGFIDSDDYATNDMFEYLYINSKNSKSDIAACGYTVIYDNGSKQKITKDLGNVIYTPREAMNIHLFSGYIDNIACNKIYKRELFDKLNFEEGKIYEDILLMPKLLNKAKKISLHTDSKYFYCKRDDSISERKFSLKTLSLIEACEKNVNYCRSMYDNLNDIDISLIQWYIVVNNKMILGNYCNQQLLYKIKSTIKVNRRKIVKCHYIGLKRKIQIFLFGYCYGIYKILYKYIKKGY